MKILVTKFNLRRNGVNYPAGSVVELPEEEARRLLKASKKEFSCVDAVTEDDAVAEELEATADGSEDVCLEEMTLDELKCFAADNGIDLGKATRKADIISVIEAAEAESEGLPAVDAAAMVK